MNSSVAAFRWSGSGMVDRLLGKDMFPFAFCLVPLRLLQNGLNTKQALDRTVGQLSPKLANLLDGGFYFPEVDRVSGHFFIQNGRVSLDAPSDGLALALEFSLDTPEGRDLFGGKGEVRLLCGNPIKEQICRDDARLQCRQVIGTRLSGNKENRSGDQDGEKGFSPVTGLALTKSR